MVVFIQAWMIKVRLKFTMHWTCLVGCYFHFGMEYCVQSADLHNSKKPSSLMYHLCFVPHLCIEISWLNILWKGCIKYLDNFRMVISFCALTSTPCNTIKISVSQFIKKIYRKLNDDLLWLTLSENKQICWLPHVCTSFF